MSEPGGKRNAFTALLQSAKKGTRTSTSKRQKLDSGEDKDQSRFSACPVCGRQVLKPRLQAHVDACIETSARPNAHLPVESSQLAAGAAENTPLSQGQVNKVELPESKGSRETIASAPEQAPNEGVKGDAFAKMMEQQRVQSRVHNFYMELTPQQTWKWHWFVTEAASDARLMAKLVVTPQPDPTPAQSTSRVSAASEDGLWRHLPQACWNSLSQIPASKLGGSPHTKVALRLLTNAPPGNGKNVGWDVPSMQSNKGGGRRYQGSVSVLKSAVQKNVRLCQPESAVRCGLHLLKEDAGEFLRRCCIICLEDAVLHPALPLMIWLMAAHSKGYIPTASQACRCLAMLYHFADAPIKDSLPQGGRKQGGSLLPLLEDAAGLGGEAAVLVRCMLCRAAWGGMPGDVELLKGFAALWAERFAGKTEGPPSLESDEHCRDWSAFIWGISQKSHARLADPDAQYNVLRIGPMTLNDIPLSAVDFHVSSIIEELCTNADIAAKAQELKVDASKALRNAMWKFRSGLNNKRGLSAKDSGAEDVAGQRKIDALWEVASPLAEAWSQQFLLRRFQ